MGFNALTLVHRFLRERVKPGMRCIDATAGRGRDTALLCRLAGEAGEVLAFDIQPQAIESTRALLKEQGLDRRARLILDSHSHMQDYAAPGSVDCIVFNFGYLPGGDRSIHTSAATSLPALEGGLRLLSPRGFLSLCIYYGGPTGYEERDALLHWLSDVDPARYTVLAAPFLNRPNDPPFPVFILQNEE